jgi:hypothetical protein
MYHSTGVQKLSETQKSKLRNGHLKAKLLHYKTLRVNHTTHYCPSLWSLGKNWDKNIGRV